MASIVTPAARQSVMSFSYFGDVSKSLRRRNAFGLAARAAANVRLMSSARPSFWQSCGIAPLPPS